MDDELRRIEEEIKRATEKRMRLLERKNRRLKEIRIRRQKEREEWSRRLLSGLHSVMIELFGDGYWYRITQKQIYDALTDSEFLKVLKMENNVPVHDMAVTPENEIQANGLNEPVIGMNTPEAEDTAETENEEDKDI